MIKHIVILGTNNERLELYRSALNALGYGAENSYFVHIGINSANMTAFCYSIDPDLVLAEPEALNGDFLDSYPGTIILEDDYVVDPPRRKKQESGKIQYLKEQFRSSLANIFPLE